jgi:hypothetical protein
MNNKKVWYVVVDYRGLKLYTYVKTKKEAEQLKKNIDNIINDIRCLTWIDFVWRTDYNNRLITESMLHGRDWQQTDNIIKDIGKYIDKIGA